GWGGPGWRGVPCGPAGCPRPWPRCPSWRAPVPVSALAGGPAAGETVTMRARLAAAGLRRAGEPARPGAPVAAADRGGGGAPDSARVAAARSRAAERIRRQRQQMQPLAWAVIAAVVISAGPGRPPPG